MFSSFENIPHIECRKIFKKKRTLTKTHHSTTGTLLGRKKEELSLDDDRFDGERKKERKKERRGERGAFGSFFFATREVKKGARLNV